MRQYCEEVVSGAGLGPEEAEASHSQVIPAAKAQSRATRGSRVSGPAT